MLVCGLGLCSVHDNICHMHNVAYAAVVSANIPPRVHGNELSHPFALRFNRRGGDILERSVEYPTGLGLFCAEAIISQVHVQCCKYEALMHPHWKIGDPYKAS